MQHILSRLIFEHDLRLVLLAAIICGLSSFAGVSLLSHARKKTAKKQVIWLVVAAVSVGVGIWGTHFIGMLSFSAGLPVGYDIGKTFLSLLIAVGFTGVGFSMVAIGRRRADAVLGGAVVGLGIVAMHYTGMTALVMGGAIVWDWEVISVSVLLGIVLGGAALHFATLKDSLGWRLIGAMTLTLAICAMHFTGMGAAGFQNCFAIVTASDISLEYMTIAVAVVSIALLLVTLAAIRIDLHDRRRNELEHQRMRGLADAAVEGLVVCDGTNIVTVNRSFSRLMGVDAQDLRDIAITDFLDPEVWESLCAKPDHPVELTLKAANNKQIAVEIILHNIDFGGSSHYAIAVRDLSARKQAEQHIRYLALNDPLTGLPNRTNFARHLEDEIVSAKRQGQSFAVLCLDLDRFKEVNDLFGHAAGDALLERVGGALRTILQDGRFAARLGGDEFAVLLPNISTPSRAGRVAEQILDIFLRAGSSTDDNPISASIGIAIYPTDADSAEHLMSSADTALYRSKQAGRGVYRYFEAAMGAEVRERRLLEIDMRHAVSRNQMSLVYQPQIDIGTGDVVGFEALIRWQHPERGNVTPDYFIPIAEESGLILQLGEWAMRTACAEAASWSNPLSIAVNVSAVQMQSAALPQMIQDTLLATGLAANRLEIEITETALVRDVKRAVATLRQIKALGVSIAMDDFGTGYSSLANLRAFQFDKIKVDRSFIKSVDTNAQSAAIVRAVLGLGSGLNVPVVAEGVETAAELAFLERETCAQAQGYLLSRPARIETFDGLTHGGVRRLAHSAVELVLRLDPPDLKLVGAHT